MHGLHGIEPSTTKVLLPRVYELSHRRITTRDLLSREETSHGQLPVRPPDNIRRSSPSEHAFRLAYLGRIVHAQYPPQTVTESSAIGPEMISHAGRSPSNI